MHDEQLFSNRRRFLGSLAAGAATLGLAGLANPLELAAQPLEPRSEADVKSFEAWLGRIKGKHKQVFDSMMLDNGMSLAYARVFLMTNKAVGAADEDVTAVLVLRHEAIPIALEDRLWAKYKIGEIAKVQDGMTKAPSERNFFWKPKPKDLPLPGMAVNELLESGVLIGVCDMALTVFSRELSEKAGMTPEDCKKDLVAGVLPGIQIVPSGVLALNRAQEHGCTYCWAG